MRTESPQTLIKPRKKRKPLISQRFSFGGEGEIRTLERFYPLHDFQSCALDQARRLLHTGQALARQRKLVYHKT